MNKEYYTQQLTQLVKEGKGYEEIRKQATTYGFHKQALKDLMREIDRVILKREEIEVQQSLLRERLLVGGVLVLFFAILFLACCIYDLIINPKVIYFNIAGFLGGGYYLYNAFQQWKYWKEEEENL